MLSRLADFGVLCIEQPLPPADLVAHAQLARVLPVPDLPRRVAFLAAARASTRCATARAPWPVSSPPASGGVRATRAAHAACAAAGVPAFVGGFFEAGLGRASNLALAARLSQDATGLVSDLGDPADYLVRRPLRLPAGGRRLGPGARRAGGREPARRRRSWRRLDAQRRWFPATYT